MLALAKSGRLETKQWETRLDPKGHFSVSLKMEQKKFIVAAKAAEAAVAARWRAARFRAGPLHCGHSSATTASQRWRAEATGQMAVLTGYPLQDTLVSFFFHITPG